MDDGRTKDTISLPCQSNFALVLVLQLFFLLHTYTNKLIKMLVENGPT